MSEEEKKVIERLKYEYKKMVDNDYVLFPLYKGQTNILINLIDKLQKENEELKKQLKVNNTFNIKESEVRTPRYIESTTLKRWWLE